MLALNAALVGAAALVAGLIGNLHLLAAIGIGVAAAASALLVNQLLLHRRFTPLERLIEEMEKVDLSRPGPLLPASIDGVGETEEVERLELAFLRMMRRLEAERRRAGSAALHAQEEERARVARDLHDEVNQSLTGLLLRLEAARADAPPSLEPELAETKALANQAMGELLQLARQLRPTALDDLGLAAAVAGQVEQLDRGEADATFAAEGDFSDLGDDAQLVVYRVAQEALSNAGRHSGAGRIEVALRRRGGRRRRADRRRRRPRLRLRGVPARARHRRHARAGAAGRRRADDRVAPGGGDDGAAAGAERVGDAGRRGRRRGTGESAAMRVLIADDHGIVRSGLRLLLERQPDIEVVAEAADGAEARDLAVRERPDLAILDVRMPNLTGLQATREIKRQAPEVAVLILSMHDDERYLFEALKAGASGYVLKAQADTDLLAAIRAVERGEPFLTPEAQRTLIKDVLERGSSGEEELTPREEEIVKLVAEANTTRQIAELLHLSEKTVENHRANAMRKLGMRDRVELVRYAIRRGLIEP